jgi:uncharacterized protein
MASTHRSGLKHRGLRVLGISAFLVLLWSGLAVPRGGLAAEPTDIPAANTTPEPRTVEEQIKLAGDYFAGRGVAQDLKQAAYWYEKAAGAGDPEAQLETGYFYDAGIGVARNPARAVHWYQLAAAGGLAQAKVNLAITYLWGDGVARDPELAVRLLREAADKRVGLAACYLGVIYQKGIGVPRDGVAADRWFEKGAKLGDPRAQFDLGTQLFVGKNHVHDFAAAADLLRASAAQGYVPAMHSLGLLLVRHPDLEKNDGEAVGMLNDAEGAGMWKSAAILGALARDGAGVPLDPVAAYYHFKVAALAGDEEARQAVSNDLKSLTAQLDASQIQSLDAQAESWRQHHQAVLEFVYKEGENRNRFPAPALAVPESGGHAAQLLPALPD